MNRQKLKLTLIGLLFIACKSKVREAQTNDTSQIMSQILNNILITEKLNVASDTVFIIKPQTKNDRWPDQISGVNIKYIAPTKQEDLIDLSPVSFNDPRTRLAIGKFLIKKDTAFITTGLHQFQKFSIHDYILIKNRNHWKVFKALKRDD
ncbi:hypothetical protein [Pedobacter kyonggii]|uniref:Uncharacterized protein n=1 Tax=Pedobacter kyonggii TaxID=1926871 RepID=A0A4Q9HGS8_9SPHI|nr:hypothetical protein [Pedobacter kyonggii]TBO44453.1 hypothetical protein EYS08_03870 [Pedobacter kyonggii]